MIYLRRIMNNDDKETPFPYLAGVAVGSLSAFIVAHDYGHSLGSSMLHGCLGFALGTVIPYLAIIGPIAYIGQKTRAATA